MSKKQDLSDEDKKLLEEVEQLIIHENKKVKETDSLYGFCAHLSSTIPRGDDDFKKSLENRLLTEIKLLKKEQLTEKQSQNNENEQNIINNTLETKNLTGWIKHKIQHILKYVPGGIIMPQTKKQKLGFVITIMLVFIINLSISIPSLRAQIIDAFQKIFVGENTIVQQIDPQSSEFKSRLINIPPDLLNNRWHIRTEIGNFGGNIFSTSNLDQAQTMSNFRIKVPETLPEGYSLREVKLILNGAFLFYGGPDHDIIISQQVVGNIFEQDHQDTQGVYTTTVTSGIFSFSDASVEEGELDGKGTTAWTGNSLVWEEDGISFSIGGLDLVQDEAISIAESLQ